ncbi:ABC transporter ATP-binding protein [Paenibacillus cymbidii]|uniref:ABC transporter ATP-binding protein n=1 Tax=Paenibacillus cymbidii TaxID=1639034 RepID=UPI001436BB8B|nr:ABC transporter ATP-binding protein [Paenibacillus cymbidii]
MGWGTREAFRIAPVNMSLFVLIAVLEGIAPVFVLYVSSNLIDVTISQWGRGGSAMISILPWVGAYIIGAVASFSLMSRIRLTIRERVSQKLNYSIEATRLKMASNLPLLTMEASETQNMLQRSSNPGMKLSNMIYNLLATILCVIQMITLSFFFTSLSHWLPVILLILQIPVLMLTSKGQKLSLALNYRQTEDQRRAGYLDSLMNGRNEQKEIRLLGLKDHLVKTWASQMTQLREESLALRKKAILLEYPGVALNFIASTVILLFAALMLPSQKLTAGLFVALYQGVAQFRVAYISFTITYRELLKTTGEVGFVRDFMQLGHSLLQNSNGDDRARTSFPEPLVEGIEFDNVTFRYPGSNSLLSGISFRLKPGEHVALVGENGSGKSTIVKLLLGLYSPEAGTIRADRQCYEEIDIQSLRQNITAAFQDYSNIALTLSQSVASGNPQVFGQDGWTPDMAVVEQAAALGGADEVANSLPGGWTQPIGKILDGAVDLSGGQWQRLALSRALIRHSQVLILDEPTSALDPKAEAELYARFMQIMRGRTVIVISHRLGSARMADRILVLKQGVIVEEGHHNDLVMVNGEYSRMWKEQSKWYN